MMQFGKTTNHQKVCGKCKECCTVLAVREGDIATPRGRTCEKLCAGGCSVYDSRPLACRTYQCMWLANSAMPAHLRPDKSGIVMHYARIHGVQIALLVFESRTGALHSCSEIQAHIQECTKTMPIFFVSPAAVRIVTKARWEQMARDYVKSNGDIIEDVYVFDRKCETP